MTTKKQTKGKNKKESNSELKSHLIDKYRQIVAARYDYKSLKKNGLPKKMTPEVVESLRSYFLKDLYPETWEREKLDAAFAELENYVVHPSKIWNILGNITSAIFKFGFQFPAAAKAGFVALEAYTSAKHFENTLTHAAVEKGYKVPLSDEQMFDCLVAIPQKDLERFITELEQLFASFTNTELLGKTISIMEDVIERMKSREDVYSANEVDAIELGLNIMRKGYALFTQYDEEMKTEILSFITENEKRFLKSIYDKRNG